MGHLSLVALDWHLQQLGKFTLECQIQKPDDMALSETTYLGEGPGSLAGSCRSGDGAHPCLSFTVAVLLCL